MAKSWVDGAIVRYSGLLGRREGILRTACRRLVMRANCAKHGARLAFDGDHIDVSKGTRIIRISALHFPCALDMARAFEDYFTPFAPAAEKGKLVIDYSRPKLHRYLSSGLEFELSSFPEEEPGDVIFDIGAYCGVSTYHFSQAVGPSGKVYAFEPDPLNFPLLERNIGRHNLTNVVPLAIAFSNKSGFAEFCTEGTPGSTLAAHSERHYPGSVRVETITFAEACAYYGVPALAKVDIEGAEIAVIRAAADVIKSHPINFTLDTSHFVAGELSNRAVEEIFRSCNYEVESSDQCGLMTTWARPARK
jgi:FkbM family methyltransferase